MAIDNVLEAFGSHIVGSGGGGGSTGGHTIEDASGTSLAQEPTLQFPDSGVSDDALNQKTVVEVIQEHSVADYATVTADGIHVCDDGNDVPIGEIEEDYVSVTADGDKTYGQLFDELYVLISASRVTNMAVLLVGNYLHHVIRKTDGAYVFTLSLVGTGARNLTAQITEGSSYYLEGNGATNTLLTTTKPSANTVITLYYGSSKSIINLLTDADNCMLDANTSVKQAITRTESNIAPIESSTTASQAYAVGDQFILNGLLYKATAAINQGGTILPNGNCALSSSVTDQLSKATVMPNLTIQSPHTGAVSGKRIGTNFGFVDMELQLDSSALNHDVLILWGMALPIESMFLTLPMVNGQNLNCVLNNNGELRTYYPGATALGRVDHNFVYPLKTAYY